MHASACLRSLCQAHGALLGALALVAMFAAADAASMPPLPKAVVRQAHSTHTQRARLQDLASRPEPALLRAQASACPKLAALVNVSKPTDAQFGAMCSEQQSTKCKSVFGSSSTWKGKDKDRNFWIATLGHKDVCGEPPLQHTPHVNCARLLLTFADCRGQ